MSAAVQSDWIEWAGGECPVRGQYVDVRLRDGFEMTEELADSLCGDCYVNQPCTPENDNWLHDGGDCDIIAYRVVSK